MTRNRADDDGDNNDRDTTMVDLKLFKTIGLYHILWPAERGGLRDRSRSALLAVLWSTVGLRFANAARLYLAHGDVLQLLDLAVLLINGLMCVYKGYVVVSNADEMLTVLDAAAYRFTLCGRRDPCELRRRRTTLSAWVRAFVTVSYGTLVLWIAAPWFFEPENNGRSSTVWALFNLLETSIYAANVLCWLWFDCYFMTACFVLNAQFDTVSAGYETLGRGVGNSPSPPTSGIRLRSAADDETTADNNYDELISHVIDNQNIIKKYDDFFDIIRPTVLIQITVGSLTTITLIILTTLAYIMGWPIVSVPVLKYFFGFVSLTFQLYIYCYALNRLEIAKDAVHVAMYRSNWTAMDLKFKKMLLLAMSMNSAHKRVLKVSPESIINLEMFARVMNMSYSIVSVLLKTKRMTEM